MSLLYRVTGTFTNFNSVEMARRFIINGFVKAIVMNLLAISTLRLLSIVLLLPSGRSQSTPYQEHSQVEGGMCSTKFDAVIVPGGGLEPGTNLPNSWVRARLDAAIKLAPDTRYFIVLSRGTTHRPPELDSRGFPITEAAASAKYLLANSAGTIEPERVLLENSSLDTIGNAFFTRVFHCEPMQLKRICVITSAFHMPRTQAIFDWVFTLNQFDAALTYVETDDLGMTREQSIARKDREIASLGKLLEFTIPTLDTVQKLSTFLFTQHTAYNAQGVTAYENSEEGAGNENGNSRGSKDVADNLKSTY